MPNELPFRSSFTYLQKLFGDTVQVRILEVLLKLLLEQENQSEEKSLWLNISEISRKAHSSKSSAKRVLDYLIDQGYLIEKEIVTHAQSPPRFFRLNTTHPAVRDLVFFYTKVRGAL